MPNFVWFSRLRKIQHVMVAFGMDQVFFGSIQQAAFPERQSMLHFSNTLKLNGLCIHGGEVESREVRPCVV